MYKIIQNLACFFSLVSLSTIVAANSANGTGFFVSSDGYVITNNHVVNNAKTIKVITGYGASHDAVIVKRDTNNDLVVLKISGTNFPFLTVSSSSDIKRGEKIFTLGFPQISIQGTEPKLTDGVISSLSGLRDEPTSFQISNPIQPGNSGGPLFTEEGDVVGVIVATLDAIGVAKITGNIPQNVNFAIKSNYVLELLRSINPTKFSQAKSSKGIFSKTKKLVDVVKQIEQSVVIVSVELDKEKNQPAIIKATPPSAGQTNNNQPKGGSGASLYKDKPLASIEECKATIPGLKKTYPQKIDSATTLKDVGCITYKDRVTIVYQYEINNISSDINLDALKAREATIRRDICTNKETKDLLNYVDVWYYYTDIKGEDLYLIANQKSQCR